jgi:hypothetical protein
VRPSGRRGGCAFSIARAIFPGFHYPGDDAAAAAAAAAQKATWKAHRELITGTDCGAPREFSMEVRKGVLRIVNDRATCSRSAITAPV